MCGLVGVAGFINNDIKRMFRDLLIFDQVRGYHSTGVASISSDKSNAEVPWVIDKDVGVPTYLYEYDMSPILDAKGVARGDVKLLLGHNRHATMGKINKEGAHPFKFGDTIGAHNGTLTYWDKLHNAKTHDIDSKALISNINENGMEHTWKSFMGAAALSVFNLKTNQLSLIRNRQRPLWITRSKDTRTLMWASEKWMLQAASSRNNVDVLVDKDGNEIYQQLTVDKHYVFNVGDWSAKLESDKELLNYVRSPVAHYSSNYSQNAGFKGGKSDYVCVVTGTVAQLIPSKTWKKNSKAMDKPLEDVTYRSARVMKAIKNGETTYFFRLDIDKKGKVVGCLDIHPRNMREFNRLNKATKQSHVFELRNPPRESDDSAVMFRRLCTTSQNVRTFEKIVAPEGKKGGDNVVEMSKNLSCLNDTPPKEYRDWLGVLVDEAEFDQLLKDMGGSCSYCASPLDKKDHEELFWANKNTCFCPECENNWHEQIHMLTGGMYAH